MTKVERQWHHRWWCACGYNYSDDGTRYASLEEPMCPDCGRSGSRLKSSKGRWNIDWHGEGSWTREEWEVWIDPDKPTEPPNMLRGTRSWWTDFCELFTFRF